MCDIQATEDLSLAPAYTFSYTSYTLPTASSIPLYIMSHNPPQPIPVDRHHINICILKPKKNCYCTLVKI